MRTSLAYLAAIFAFGSQAADFSQMEARQPPEWARDGVIYEINVATFSKAGSLAGVTAQLDRLQKLGVTVLWLMPIHPNGQVKKKGTYGSPYAVRDYDAIEPNYGTGEDLKRLTGEAHRRGMHVLIDIVPNHTAWDSVLMAHPEYYKKDAQGHIIPPLPDWDDVAALDYTNAGLREYMIGMMERWLRDYALDGFRCDAAGMVPTDFWEQARPRLDKVKPDVFMLAEWNSPDLLVHAFDADYAWPLHKTLTEVLQTGKSAREIRATLEAEQKRFPRGAVHMNFSDNHDEKRAIARFGEGGALAASALVFALDGVPMIYNGMEAGDTTESGGPALFAHLPVFWPIASRRPEFLTTYQTLIRLRRENAALRRGTLTWLTTGDDVRLVAFARGTGAEQSVFVVNLSNRPFAGSVKVQDAGGWADAQTGAAVDLSRIGLEAWGWKFYRRATL